MVRLQRWYEKDEKKSEKQETEFLVVEYAIRNLPKFELQVLDRLLVVCSEISRTILEKFQQSLTIVQNEDGSQVLYADLCFRVNKDLAERVLKLLKQEKRNKNGELLMFTNSYHFILCVEDVEHPGFYFVTARLAVTESLPNNKTRFVLISCTTGLQQMIRTYFAPEILKTLPNELVGGVCQEVAQQVTSYIAQVHSSKVKSETSFPTVESRDPKARLNHYELAIDFLAFDLRPLEKTPIRELDPGSYGTNDKRGDRLIVSDERWKGIVGAVEAKSLTLFFMTGDAVPILKGEYIFPAGVSKSDRHQGNLVPSVGNYQKQKTRIALCLKKTGDVVFMPLHGVSKAVSEVYYRKYRSDCHKIAWGFAHEYENITAEQRGVNGLTQYYVAVPFYCSDSIIQNLNKNQNNRSRGLNLQFKTVNLYKKSFKLNYIGETHLLLPLSCDKLRAAKILESQHLEIALSRLVKKQDGGWYLQLSLRVPLPEILEQKRPFLGVSFGLNAIVSWSLLDENGICLKQGSLAPNPQILEFLKRKLKLENDQKTQKWTGGKGFQKKLKTISHNVTDEILALAKLHNAQLAVVDVSYVQKSGPNHESNVLYSAWNYAQLRNVLGYKAPLIGVCKPIFISDFVVNFTCPLCGKCRKKGQDSKAKADTWLEKNSLSCKCGFVGVVNGENKSRIIACEAFKKMTAKK